MSVHHLPYVIDPEKNRHEFYENYWKIVSLNLAAKYFDPKDKTLLDYGCGRGEALKIAGELGFRSMGTDADPECVRIAKQYGQTQLLNPYDPVAQFGKNSFDAVCCFHVLEHVDNPKKVLNDLRLIARSYIILAVPNLRQLHGLFRRRIDISAFNEGHLHGWDHLHLRNLAERHCGLELIEWGFDNTQLPLLSNVSQILFGNRFTIWLETGLFLKLFPFHCCSIIGLFRVK